MSEVQSSDSGSKKGGKPKAKKQSTHIDMTPMVDLAFLLLTFFMLATTFNKPAVMEVAMPDDTVDKKDQTELDDDDAFTVLLGENNKLLYYLGIGKNGNAPQLVSSDYSPKGLRQALITRLALRPKLMVLIKPSDKSSYKNLVDVFDEMNITKQKRFAMVAITPEEDKFLESK
jgi:biopolymer transport protein ExbD